MNGESEKGVCRPVDLEDELRESRAVVKKQMQEIGELRKCLEAAESEAARMRAQLDIIYLIFGRQ